MFSNKKKKKFLNYNTTLGFSVWLALVAKMLALVGAIYITTRIDRSVLTREQQNSDSLLNGLKKEFLIKSTKKLEPFL
jgi:heme exporter protein D